MKKMMASMFAVATMVVSANAISLNWAVPNSNFATDGTTLLANKTVALIMASSSGALASSISYNWNGSSWTIGGGKLVNVTTLNASGKFASAYATQVGAGGLGAWGTDNYVGVDFVGGATTVLSQATGSGGLSKYFMIVFDNTYQSGNYTVLSPASTTQVSGPAANGTVTIAAVTGAATTWTAVPEPTSMALLALGAAALGLRRKFRK